MPHAEDFTCPITQAVIDIPIQTNCNHIYEKKAIKDWHNTGHNTCPVCRKYMFPFQPVSALYTQQLAQFKAQANNDIPTATPISNNNVSSFTSNQFANDDQLKLHVYTLSANFTMEVKSNTTIQDLKQFVGNKTGISPHRFTLFYGTLKLTDENKTLRNYHLNDEDDVYLLSNSMS